MAESPDWKSKYVDAVRDMERQEAAWVGLEKILRRLVTRLCAAASGVDERLDLQLSSVSQAIRGQASAVDLQALSDSLSETILALEKSGAVAPPAGRVAPPTAGIRTSGVGVEAAPQATPAAPQARQTTRDVPLTATIASVRGLLEQLSTLDAGGGHAAACSTQLAAATTDSAVARVLDQVADLVRERGEAVARDRREAAAMLSQVTSRLEEMATYLAGSSEVNTQSFAEVDSLNSQVLREMAELTSQAEHATDLAPLRALVADRLEAVATRVREFRAHQEARFVANAERIERLRARIGELESQTTALHRGLAAERRHARTDVLTGIANRAAFDERLVEEIERRRRFRTPVSVLVWDIDHFKRINDDYGHRSGDAVLREVARALSARKRATDHLARYGGEEFVMLLVGTPASEALRVADGLREKVATLKFGFRGTPLRVTVSCGITELQDSDDAQTVFDRADAALYRAKNAGRNRCEPG